MSQPLSSHYTFGDNDLAAARLERLASVYAPSSAAFLRAALPKRVELAVDLGCAIGLTTELLDDLSQAHLTVGYERSTKYIHTAVKRFPLLTFRQVDVLVPPYPDREMDVIYSRFLLTHVHDPQRVIAACLDHLRPGGRLLLEETSDLSSPISTLQDYYAMVAKMQAHYGQVLTIGLRLESLASSLPDCRVITQQTEILLAAKTMTQLHAMNIATWKRDPYMLATHGMDALDQLESALNALIDSSDEHPPVSSVMAQVIVERH